MALTAGVVHQGVIESSYRSGYKKGVCGQSKGDLLHVTDNKKIYEKPQARILWGSQKMKNDAIKIIIADDHPIVRDALKNMLSDSNMSVVAEAESGDEVMDVIDKVECDLLILDMAMPGHPVGPELISKIKGKQKAMPPVLVFSMSNDSRTAADALQAGGSGYLTKDSEPTEILEAIHKVAAGGKYISPDIAEEILFGKEKEGVGPSPHELLSKREYQIFLLLVKGKSIEAIASELCISRQTVGTHKTRMMRKLGLKNNMEIIRYAIMHGLISV